MLLKQYAHATHFLTMCSYIKEGTIVTVIMGPPSAITAVISLSLMPTTFCPFTSRRWWSVSRPLRAADESLTRPVIFPFLNWNPTWPTLSLCKVTVRSNGLRNSDKKVQMTNDKWQQCKGALLRWHVHKESIPTCCTALFICWLVLHVSA